MTREKFATQIGADKRLGLVDGMVPTVQGAPAG